MKTDVFFGLSVRARNCLRRAGITSVEQLAETPELELFKIRSFGRYTMKEIKDFLASRGFGCNEQITYETKLRDLCAVKAMASYLSLESVHELMSEDSCYDLRSIASDAYKVADLMLEARKK